MSTMLNFLIAAATGYLLGCIQTAYILGKLFKKIDIREHGTTNSGASNATIVMGWRFGVVTALADILKAAVAVLLVRHLMGGSGFLALSAGLFSIIGHIYPVFLSFKGGKGAASLIGMAFAFDWRIGTSLALAIVVITIASDYIALGTIFIFAAFPLSLYVLGYPLDYVYMAVLVGTVGIARHISNIKKIIRKEEKGLRAVLKKKK